MFRVLTLRFIGLYKVLCLKLKFNSKVLKFELKIIRFKVKFKV